MKPFKILLAIFLLFFVIGVSGAPPGCTSFSVDVDYAKNNDSITSTLTCITGFDANVDLSTLDSNGLVDQPLKDNLDGTYTYTHQISSSNENIDGEKTLTVSACNGEECDLPITDTVYLDNTAPTTTSDATSTWQTANFSVTFTCDDSSGSGCSSTDYNKGSGWVSGLTVLIDTDGNHQIDFNSMDNVGKIESTKTVYALRDSAVPTINNIVASNSELATGGGTVSFDVNDSLSGINLNTLAITINDIASTITLDATHCNAFDTNYHCSYTETAFEINNTSYTIKVNAQDNAENNATEGSHTFTFMDSVNPSQISELTPSAGNTQVTLNWATSTANDLNHYNIYMHTASFTDLTDKLIAVVSTGTTTYTKTGLTNGDQYFFRVSAEDKSGNEGDASAEQSATPSVDASDLSSPSISSSTHNHDEWSTNNNPEFSWNSVSDADYYSYEFNQTSDTTPATGDNDTTSTSYNPSGTQSDGLWYFHIRACNSNGCSSTSRFTIKIDRTGPDQPGSFYLNANPNGTVDIDWDAPADNPDSDNSGILEYKIYRRINDDTPNDSDVIATVTSTFYNDDDSRLNDGVRYYYRVRAMDTVGNAGSLSARKSIQVIKSDESCKLDFSHSIKDFVNTGEVIIKINSNKTMKNPVIKARIQGGEIIDGEAINYKSTSAQATYTIGSEEDGEKLEITLTADDSSGVSCFFRERFTIDGVKPTINWIFPLEGGGLDLTTPIKLSAKAADEQSGVEKVVFYYKQNGSFKKIGEDTTGTSSDEFSVEMPSTDLKLGSLVLKVEAIDKVGYKAEKTLTVKIVNVPGGESIYEQVEFVFDLENLEEMLIAAGLIEEFIAEAKGLLTENTVNRELVITQTAEGEFKVKIVIKFLNNSEKTLDIKIAEVIPKVFAQKAEQITSVHDFVVLLNDPALEFSFFGVKPGQQIEFEYSLAKGLSKEEADEFIGKNPLQEFVSPPIILNADKDLSNALEKKPFEVDIIFIIFILIIVILIVLIGLAFFGGGLIFHLHRKSKRGQSSIESKITSMGPGPMERTSEQLKNWFNQKEKEQKPGGKFKWKGK